MIVGGADLIRFNKKKPEYKSIKRIVYRPNWEIKAWIAIQSLNSMITTFMVDADLLKYELQNTFQVECKLNDLNILRIRSVYTVYRVLYVRYAGKRGNRQYWSIATNQICGMISVSVWFD